MSARDCCIKGVEPPEKCIAVSTARSGRSDEPSKPFDIREFSPLLFSRALVQYLLIMSLFIPFGIIMYILCHCMLEVCNLLFEFTRG